VEGIVGISEPLAISIFSGYSVKAPFAAVTRDRVQMFPHIHCSSGFGRRPVARQRLLHRSANALDEYGTQPWMTCFVSAPDTVPENHRGLLGEPIAAYATRCTRSCTQFDSIQDLWDAMLFTMKSVLGGELWLEHSSGNFDTSTQSIRAQWQRTLH